MAEEQKDLEQEMDDVELAELANKELKKRDAEIAKLKKDLAKAKLYSEATDEEEETKLTKKECISRIFDSKTCNYDYAEAVINLVDIEKSEGKQNPLGSNGDEVYDFLKQCIEDCDGDKNLFTSIYYSSLGKDDREVALAYNSRKNK